VRFFDATTSNKSGRDYLRLKKSIERLCAAKFTLQIEKQGVLLTYSFKIIETGEVSEKEIKITISNWTKSRIEKQEVLKLHKNYMLTRGLITRRIYEICRKHCGNKNKFLIRMEVFVKRIGSTSKNRSHIIQEINKFNQSDLGYYITIAKNGHLTIRPKEQTPS